MPRKAGGKTQQELERELEEGLRETFPASDPPTATQPVPHDDQPKKRARKHASLTACVRPRSAARCRCKIVSTPLAN